MRLGAEPIGDVVQADQRDVQPLGRGRVGHGQLDIAQFAVEPADPRHLAIAALPVEMGGDDALGGIGHRGEQIVDRADHPINAIGPEQPDRIVVGVGHQHDVPRQQDAFGLGLQQRRDIADALVAQRFEDRAHRPRIHLQQRAGQMVDEVAVAFLAGPHRPERPVIGHGAAHRQEDDARISGIAGGAQPRIVEGDRRDRPEARRAGRIIRLHRQHELGHRLPAFGRAIFGEGPSDHAQPPRIGPDEMDVVLIDVGDAQAGEQRLDPIGRAGPADDRRDHIARARNVQGPPGGGIGIVDRRLGPRHQARMVDGAALRAGLDPRLDHGEGRRNHIIPAAVSAHRPAPPTGPSATPRRRPAW